MFRCILHTSRLYATTSQIPVRSTVLSLSFSDSYHQYKHLVPNLHQHQKPTQTMSLPQHIIIAITLSLLIPFCLLFIWLFWKYLLPRLRPRAHGNEVLELQRRRNDLEAQVHKDLGVRSLRLEHNKRATLSIRADREAEWRAARAKDGSPVGV